ncbi:MAG TPA: hypothetical protein VMX11_00160 [Actinomycetes bacterium]|nr:hypothetical protein [Actinomycetes bacterium]
MQGATLGRIRELQRMLCTSGAAIDILSVHQDPVVRKAAASLSETAELWGEHARAEIDGLGLDDGLDDVTLELPGERQPFTAGAYPSTVIVTRADTGVRASHLSFEPSQDGWVATTKPAAYTTAGSVAWAAYRWHLNGVVVEPKVPCPVAAGDVVLLGRTRITLTRGS